MAGSFPLLPFPAAKALPENDRTRALDPAARFEASHALLARLFAARLQKVPLCLLLDDAHTLSSDALALVSRLAHGVPQLLVIMAQRPKRATASPASPKPAAADGGSPGGAPSND